MIINEKGTISRGGKTEGKGKGSLNIVNGRFLPEVNNATAQYRSARGGGEPRLNRKKVQTE